MPFEYLDDSPSSGKFEYLDEPGYWEKTASNILPDLEEVTRQFDGPLGKASSVLPGPLGVGADLALQGKQAYEMASHPVETAESLAKPIIHPVDYLQEHPVQQAMNIFGLKEGVGGMMGKKPPVSMAEAAPKLDIPPEAPAAVLPEPFSANDLAPMGGGKGGKSATLEAAEDFASNPPKPQAIQPEAPAAVQAPPSAVDPLKDVREFVSSKLGQDPLRDVREFVNSKTQKLESQPGWPTRAAKYLKQEANNFGAKDLGLQMRQVRSMGPGFEGPDKAAALIDYAREKGYLDPTLSDVSRKEKIISTQKASGAQMDAVRNIAESRGTPPLDAIKAAVQQQLEADYGNGVEKATDEIKNVMDEIEKARPTFTGISELATKLNKSATKVKDLGQHPGPTTDAANLISRMNNEAIRGVLNPQEAKAYTESLRDYGANKKLEQAVSGADIRKMTARMNQRGILGPMFQEALDRGGYRFGGNVANKVADTILKNPGKIKTLPEFFEELAHQSNEALDDFIDGPGMYEGGMVPEDIAEFVRSR